jgi:ribonuclease HI
MSREIIVFTDGSCIKNKLNHNNLCGYGIHYPNGEFPDHSAKFTDTPLTNQRTELYAIYKAIENIHNSDKNLDIKIYSDSEYSIKSLTIWIHNWKKNNWIGSTGKPVMNQDIIEKIDNLIKEHNGKIKFQHVKSHTGKLDFESIHNDIADKLATSGARK